MQLKNFWVLTVVLVLLSLSDMKSIKKNELNITKEEIKKFVVSFGKGTTSALFPYMKHLLILEYPQLAIIIR